MIPLSLGELAAVVGGRVEGDGAVTVSAPAVLDGRRAEPGGLFVAFTGEHVDGHDFAVQAGRAGAVAVLGSRPTALPTVVVEDAEAALQALAAHVVARLREGLTVLAVTGSRGKTSTKDLLAAVLSSAAPTIATTGSLNNELGVPLTMLRCTEATRFLVLEMGVRRIGDIAELTSLVAPDVGVVLNVGQAHLCHLKSRAAIARAKGELVQGLAPGGTAVLGADDPRVAAMRSLTDRAVLTFGRLRPGRTRRRPHPRRGAGPARPAVLHPADRRRPGHGRAAARWRSPGAQRLGCRGGGAGGRRPSRCCRGGAAHRLAVEVALGAA